MCVNVSRLQARGAHDGNPLPTQLLRVYIEYARAYCRPVLSDAAKAVLQDFYVQLRSSAVGTEGIPITVAQQLLSLHCCACNAIPHRHGNWRA